MFLNLSKSIYNVNGIGTSNLCTSNKKSIKHNENKNEQVSVTKALFVFFLEFSKTVLSHMISRFMVSIIFVCNLIILKN